MSSRSHVFASPVGAILATADGEQLTGLKILTDPVSTGSDPDPLLAETERQIAAYFAGGFTVFELPLAPASTPRGEEIRAGMCAIPFGATQSYGELANRLESGPRAIGQACARNPFPIIVPCHRVTGAGGGIGHYSGGRGVDTKRALLVHENPEETYS